MSPRDLRPLLRSVGVDAVCNWILAGALLQLMYTFADQGLCIGNVVLCVLFAISCESACVATRRFFRRR